MEPAAACEFCEIVRGTAGARVVCESQTALAFFPRKPASLGHTLVIPKQHVPDFLALEPEVTTDVFNAVIQVGRALRRALEPDGMNAITSAGRAASQSVFHVHVHLVPRWHEDRIGDIWPPTEPWPDDVTDEVAERVRQECLSPSGD